MSQTIHKYILSPLLPDTQPISVLDGGILSTAVQGNDIVIWAIGDPERPLIQRRVAVVGTGHPAPRDWRFVGTVLLERGSLVFHVFETAYTP